MNRRGGKEGWPVTAMLHGSPGKRLTLVIIGLLCLFALIPAAYFLPYVSPGNVFYRQYHRLMVGMPEEEVNGTFGRQPDHVCKFRSFRILYFVGSTPFSDEVPEAAPERVETLEALPYIYGAAQVVVDEQGAVKAFTWQGEDMHVHTAEGSVRGARLDVLGDRVVYNEAQRARRPRAREDL